MPADTELEVFYTWMVFNDCRYREVPVSKRPGQERFCLHVTCNSDKLVTGSLLRLIQYLCEASLSSVVVSCCKLCAVSLIYLVVLPVELLHVLTDFVTLFLSPASFHSWPKQVVKDKLKPLPITI